MINRLENFRKCAKQNGYQTAGEIEISPEGVTKDITLIKPVLPIAKKIIIKLRTMEGNNKSILDLKKKQVQEASGHKEKEYSETLAIKVKENQDSQKFVKESLDGLRLEVANAK